ncbi:MAG: type II secretion system protein GspJ [Verrucomicrobiota bacterium]
MPPHAGRFRPPAGRSGMTLIELLLAIVIAVLVAALVFSVYHVVSVTLQGQQARRRGPDAAARALEQLARDLECTYAVPGDDTTKLSVSAGGGESGAESDLSFCTAILPEGETDLRWFEIQRVRYRVTAEAAGHVLLRESQALAGPGAAAPPVTNTLAEGIERFRVAVYDGSGWKGSWPEPGPDSPTCPRAARLEIEASSGSGTRGFQTEVFIPAGNVITSAVVRAARLGVAAGQP